MSDMPEPEPGSGIVLIVYADDVTILVSHESVKEAERRAQA